MKFLCPSCKYYIDHEIQRTVTTVICKHYSAIVGTKEKGFVNFPHCVSGCDYYEPCIAPKEKND